MLVLISVTYNNKNITDNICLLTVSLTCIYLHFNTNKTCFNKETLFSLCRDTTAGHYIIKAYPQLLALLLFSSSPMTLPLPLSLISHIADIPPQSITSKLHFVLVKPRLPGSLLGTVIKKLLFYFIIGRCNITQESALSVCVSVSSFKVWYVKWGYQPFCDSSHVYVLQSFYLFFARNRLLFIV